MSPVTSSAPRRPIDVQEFLDAHAVSTAQRMLVALCFLVVAIDGFDTAIVGFIAPAIRAEWSVPVTSLGPLFAAGLFGLMIGSFAVGPLADRFGRKTMLIASMVWFGAACLASSFSVTFDALVWLRFATGVGLGGAMPTAITLTAEFSPSRRRSSLVTLMFCGFTIGSAFGGLAAAHVVTAYGWRPLLVAGGLMPILLAPLLWLALPESVRYLASTRDGAARVRATLQRLAPTESLEETRFVASPPQGLSPMRTLFAPELWRGTLLLWGGFFMSLFVVYLLSNWMPTLIQRTGLSLGAASLVTAMFQIGGTVGAVVLGYLMDRFDPHAVLATAYVIGSACVALIGAAAGVPWLMVGAVFGAGFCVSGGQVGANALAAAFYPTSCRTTGVSWAIGTGRCGSILGSFLGAAMLSQGWSLGAVYGAVAIPAAVSAGAIMALGVVRARMARAPRG